MASHSALQILHGAKKEGLRTVLISIEERLELYNEFSHLVDKVLVIRDWREICNKEFTSMLRQLNSILVPHGSFVEYVGPECAEDIEVPIFGLRSIVRVEADQWSKIMLLQRAGIPVPRTYRVGDKIEGMVIVKLPGAKGGKGYFVSDNAEEIVKKLARLVEEGLLRDVSEAMIQEYVVGVPAYYHYFYSPLLNRVEIMGADIRYETNIDGLRRLPPSLLGNVAPSFVVVGNIPLVMRESLLPEILAYGRRFVEQTQRDLPPGIIGPFSLESIVTPSLEIKVFEFSGRIVAGTNLYINGSPYSWLYWDEPMSTGRRIAREIRMALERDRLVEVVT
ncbi:MAG: formate--phosphoribosylaminoimidazolecarboxamide ligase [Pyrodictiaceae archaeon]